MYYLIRRGWVVVAFFLSIFLGDYLASNLGLGELGYGIGCVSGIVIWLVGLTILSSIMGPEKAEREYTKALKEVQTN
jgi:hypothetical protein